MSERDELIATLVSNKQGDVDIGKGAKGIWGNEIPKIPLPNLFRHPIASNLAYVSTLQSVL